jgi:hypothetical protein
MNHPVRRSFVVLIALLSSLVVVPGGAGATQDTAPPVQVELPCASTVSVQVLGRIPFEGGNDIALVRIIWGPDGSIGAHTHPAVMWVTVESGQFGLTLLEDAEMTVTRAASTGSEGTEETLVRDVEVVLEAQVTASSRWA